MHKKTQKFQEKEIRYGKKVRDIFPIDIFSQLFEQFQSINRHFKERFKVYLLYKNEGSSLRNKRDINVRISFHVFQTFYVLPEKNSYTICNAR